MLVHRRADGSRAELTPRGFDARTRVHEYGGGAAWRHGDTFFFSHFGDGRVYRVDGADGEPRPITPEPAEPNALRYADGRVTADGSTVFCVREPHGAGRRERARRVSGGRLGRAACGRHRPRLLRVRRASARMGGSPTSRGTTRSFRSSGLRAPGSTTSGSRAARTSRSSSRSGGPTAGCTGSPTATAGGTSTATASSSRRSRPSSAYPPWLFGLSTYGFLADGRIACTVIEKAVHSFARARPGDARARPARPAVHGVAAVPPRDGTASPSSPPRRRDRRRFVVVDVATRRRTRRWSARDETRARSRLHLGRPADRVRERERAHRARLLLPARERRRSKARSTSGRRSRRSSTAARPRRPISVQRSDRSS